MSDLMKEQILEEAARHFFSFGYSKVTTDSLAAHLGISKKTLYKYFPSKKLLLSESMRYIMEQFGSRLPNLSCETGKDFATQFRQLLVLAANHIAEVNLPILQYLQQKEPELWAEIENFRKQTVAAQLKDFWERGVNEGKIKPDIDHDAFFLIFMNSVRSITAPNSLFSETVAKEQLIQTIVHIFADGIFVQTKPE